MFAAFNQIDPKHRIADGAHHCDSELSGLILKHGEIVLKSSIPIAFADVTSCFRCIFIHIHIHIKSE